MNTDALRDDVFGDTLVCEETRPAGFRPGDVDAADARAGWLRGEALLRALAVVEDSRTDEAEEHGATDLSLHRIEAKLDLLTALVAALAPRDAQDAPRALQWSAHGACLALAGAADAPPGSAGMFRVQPCDWLPEQLRLPARVVANDGRHLWLRFDPPPPALAAALERHLFRVHRRAVAEMRRPRD